MKAVVIEPYERPYKNPIAVSAGEQVIPDFDKPTDIYGWVWCTAKDGQSGWTPKEWLTQSNGIWFVDREFNAIELTVVAGDPLEVAFEESGFYWVKTEDGESGWVPCECISIARQI
jgi:hypothetical protein